jgi:thioredoxin-like negative regulator of GroEL
MLLMTYLFAQKHNELQKCKNLKNSENSEGTNNEKTNDEQFNNEDEKKQKNNPIKLVLYKSKNCYHCNEFLPVWEQIKTTLKQKYSQKQLEVSDIECSGGDSRCNTPYIRGVPTIILYKNDNSPYVYDDSRTKKQVLAFVEQHMEH